MCWVSQAGLQKQLFEEASDLNQCPQACKHQLLSDRRGVRDRTKAKESFLGDRNVLSLKRKGVHE